MVNQIRSISPDLQLSLKHSIPYLTHFSPNTLSPVSISFLSTFFHKIHNANLKWSIEKDSIINTKTGWSNKSTYISENKFTLEIGEKTFHIMIWFPTYIRTANNITILMSDIQIQEKIHKILQKVYIWLSIATSFINKNTKCSKIVNVYFFLTEHTKILPNNDNSPISFVNVNTAFTTGCINAQMLFYITQKP